MTEGQVFVESGQLFIDVHYPGLDLVNVLVGFSHSLG